MNSNVSCGLWVMVHHVSPPSVTALVKDTHDGEAVPAAREQGGIWETQVLSPQFCCGPKTILEKTKSLKITIGNGKQQNRVGEDGV